MKWPPGSVRTTRSTFSTRPARPGSPKGAMLSHRNILLNAFYAGECQRLDHTDRICLPVPLYHCFGCVLGTLCCVVHGSAMVFPAESFQPGATLAAIEQRALHGALRRAHDVHRHVGARRLSAARSVVAADRDHGRQPVSDRDDEARHAGNGRPRNHDRLRPDGSVAADHADAHRRSDRAARRHGRPADSRASKRRSSTWRRARTWATASRANSAAAGTA